MKIALINDIHVGTRNDSLEFDAYFEKFYRHVFFPTLEEHGIKTVVILGDIFDRRKFINFQILHNAKRYLFDKLKPYDVYALVGNHDSFYKNTLEVNSLDLLLAEYKNIKVVSTPTYETFDGTSVLLMPWICADNETAAMTELANPKADILFGHLEVIGGQMYRGNVCEHGMEPETFKHFDVICSGHFHHRADFYLGNPYEITWADYDDPRGFHLFDTATRDLEFIQNPFTMFEKLYYDDTDAEHPAGIFRASELNGKYVKIVVLRKTDAAKFDQFIQKIEANNPLDIKIEEDFSEYEGVIVDTDNIDMRNTENVLLSSVDALETDANKDLIKYHLRSLYVEAVNSRQC